MKLTILCLSLIAIAGAADLQAGEREDGDVLVASRRLLRTPVPGKPTIAKSGFNTEGTITSVSAVNAPGSNANVAIVKGGPGTSSVVVVAIGEPGSALDVQLDIYAKPPSSIPTTSSPSD